MILPDLRQLMWVLVIFTSKEKYIVRLLKRTSSKDASWPENAKNAEIFPCAGLVWLFHQYLCNRSILSFQFVVLRALLWWFTLQRWTAHLHTQRLDPDITDICALLKMSKTQTAGNKIMAALMPVCSWFTNDIKNKTNKKLDHTLKNCCYWQGQQGLFAWCPL